MSLSEHRNKLNQKNPIKYAAMEWQVAPREHEIANYDEPKFRYRRHVENYIKSIPNKSILKRSFYTISTNVLCADISTKDENRDPIDRDIYLPLEIAITKWSINDGKIDIEERKQDSRVWFLDPGSPTSGSVSYSKDHSLKHKIELDGNNHRPVHQYIEPEPVKVLKAINSFLPADRTVFSLELKKIRQDLGCLKWLNQQGGYRSSPVKVYDLENLYVVLIRRFNPDARESIGLGVAHLRMEHSSDPWDDKNHCEYHKKRNDAGECCRFCAKNLSRGWSNVLINDCLAMTEAAHEENQAGPQSGH